MSDQHESLIKTPKQLIVIVALAFVVPIALIALVSQLVTGGGKGGKDSDNAVLERIRPVGEVVIAGSTGPRAQQSGEQVYVQVCKNCHEAGIAGAPTFGDPAAWAKRLAQGAPLVVEHAIKGIRAMPARGGNPDLADAEVERAVVYMANKAGAGWKQPAAPAPVIAAATPAAAPPAAAVAPAATPAPAAAPAAPAAAAAPASAGKPDGRKVYDSVCTVCHATGVAGSPKFGDKAAWAPRIKTGIDALYASALKGKAAMPAKGGNAALADADVKAAVDYLVAAGR